jgi:hypothetical protein
MKDNKDQEIPQIFWLCCLFLQMGYFEKYKYRLNDYFLKMRKKGNRIIIKQKGENAYVENRGSDC